MIKKKHRFTTKQFERSFLYSKKIFIDDFAFFISNSKTDPKIGATVSKKNLKRAVDRNRVRRKMYDILNTGLFNKIGQKNLICLYKGKTVENCKKLETIMPKLVSKLETLLIKK